MDDGLPCWVCQPMTKGDIIMGEIKTSADNKIRFEWWTGGAEPLYKLHRLFTFKNEHERTSAPRLCEMLLFHKKKPNKSNVGLVSR